MNPINQEVYIKLMAEVLTLELVPYKPWSNLSLKATRYIQVARFKRIVLGSLLNIVYQWLASLKSIDPTDKFRLQKQLHVLAVLLYQRILNATYILDSLSAN